MKTVLIFALLLASVVNGAAFAAPERAEDFRLTDHRDRSQALYRLADSAAVVLFTYGNDCPAVQQAAPGLKEAIAEFAPKNVQFLGLDPVVQDTRQAVAAKAQKLGLDFPILMDEAQTVTSGLACAHLAEAIVLDTQADWKIVYRGDSAKLREVLTAHLAKQPLPAAAPAPGSAISYAVAPASISYEKDIVPILEAKCVSCHHTGGIAPFTMTSLKKVQGMADMIREVILTKRMPPWHADPHFGEFTNDRSLTAKEQAALLAWLDAGAQPTPDVADPLATLAVKEQTWALGTPDLVLSLPEPEQLPAEGVVDYRYRYVPSGLSEDKWIRGLEVQAGNPKLVHHALIFIIYPKEYRHLQPEARSGLGGYFASFLPGAIIKPYPDGTGQWVPKGSIFVFQMHYTPTGKPETDQTRMALYFHDQPPAEEFKIEAAHENEFAIPPNAMDHVVTADYRFDAPAKIWAVSPHMHYRGSRFRFDVRLPDGPQTTVLNVPFYQFDWQPLYLLKDPVVVPAKAEMFCEGGFDNSRFNPKNPNPNQMIFFGEQSFEEMFIGYVGYSVPRDDSKRTPLPAERVARMGFGQPITAENIIGTKWRLAGRFVIEFKEDGKITANNLIPGTWTMSGNRISIVNPIQPVDIGVVGDELFFNSRSMRHLRPGQEDNAEPWEQRRRRRDGEGRGNGEQRGGERRGVGSFLEGLLPKAPAPGESKPAETPAPAPQAANATETAAS